MIKLKNISENIKTIKKSLNEDKKQGKKWAKLVQSKTGYKTKEMDGGVMIPEGPSPNSDWDGKGPVWGWTPGDTAWMEAGHTGLWYDGPEVKNIDDFIDLVNNYEDTEGDWS